MIGIAGEPRFNNDIADIVDCRSLVRTGVLTLSVSVIELLRCGKSDPRRTSRCSPMVGPSQRPNLTAGGVDMKSAN